MPCRGAGRRGRRKRNRLDAARPPRAAAAARSAARLGGARRSHRRVRRAARTARSPRWTTATAQSPGPGEIAIEVRAAGVNFRDVMVGDRNATGRGAARRLRRRGARPRMRRSGLRGRRSASKRLAIGDRVVGFAPAALASRVVTRADAVIALPPCLDFAAAATLPVAFVTARYSLVTLARLLPGETVLIHAASGGVGLAAIQIAKACGATVIASAGSPAKRAFLRLVGADHVCDLRELRFVAAVREATGGAGSMSCSIRSPARRWRRASTC